MYRNLVAEKKRRQQEVMLNTEFKKGFDFSWKTKNFLIVSPNYFTAKP